MSNPLQLPEDVIVTSAAEQRRSFNSFLPASDQVGLWQWETMLRDPVAALYALTGVVLDEYQAARLRYYWFVPNVIDSSGFSSAKTFCFWAFIQLRCILIPNHIAGVYYMTFSTGQQTFWPYYAWCKHPIFRSQFGGTNEEGDDVKGNSHGAACWLARYRNGSEVKMPAPSWGQDAKSQAGLRYNTVGIDEWTKVESTGTQGINQQILGRVTRASYNQHHPLWCNHRVFLATAETLSHPAYNRYRVFRKEERRGNPNFATLSFSFKDYSKTKRCHTGKTFAEEYRIEETLAAMKAQFTPSHWLREGLGIWARETKGWYSEAALGRCLELGRQLRLQPEGVRPPHQNDAYYFLGVDPAPAQGKRSDDGALVIGKAWPRSPEKATSNNRGDWHFGFVWAYRLRNAGVRQWSGFTHQKHQHFNLAGILLDPGGGGQWIMGELNKSAQVINGVETQCVPIACPMDATVANAHFLLNLFKRGDSGIDALWPLLQGDDNLVHAMHVAMQEAVEHGEVAFPAPYNSLPAEVTAAWPEEVKWANRCLDAVRSQLEAVQVATKEDGTWLLTRRNALQFSAAAGKKDLAYAAIYAYVRFLIWLKTNEQEFATGGDSGFWGCSA